MKSKTWNNVAGCYSVETMLEDGKLVDLGSEFDIAFLRQFVADPDSSEIAINFVSSGHYEPASMYGGWDCLGWPEEGSEDREFVSAEVLVNGTRESVLPEVVGRRLFDLYKADIDSKELDWSEE